MATLQELFIDMINAKNPALGLTLDDVDFGNPTPFAVEGNERNSALILTAKASSPKFKGSKEYHFRRFDLTHPNGEDTYSLATSDLLVNFASDDYVLALFNRNLPNNKLLMSEVTITRGEVNHWDGGPNEQDVKIRIDPNHLKWHGAFVIRCVDEGKDNLMWKNGELDGFE